MKPIARLLAIAGAVIFLAGHARAAVAVSSLRVSGTHPPYAIGYTLGQDATRLSINIRRADTGEIVRTFLSIGLNMEITAADMKMGPHPNVLLWDGRMDDGQAAPSGTYYPQSIAIGNGASTLRLLSGPNPFTAASGKSEARGLYGGDVNRNVDSPYRNLAYFAVTASNSSGSAGLEVVDADGNSALFSLPEKTATGAYDYVSASVLDDDAVLVDGQSWMRLTAVRPDTGAIQAAYATGKVNGRTMKAFGSGAAARAYYVSADETGVYLINPLTGTPTLIVPRSALPGNARGLEVKPDESTLYVSGDTGYVYKFNRPASGNAWVRDTSFNMTALTGEVRGVALTPAGAILWVANNNTADTTKNQVIGVNALSGAVLSSAYQYAFGTDLSPQGMAVSAGGNIFVQGWRGSATGTSANSIAVLAPPEGATADQTVGNRFTIPAVSGTIGIAGGPDVSGVTFHGATVKWQTTVPSNSILQIGTSPGVYTRTLTVDSAPDLVTWRSITLDDLNAATTWYYRVLSMAAGYASAASPAGSFTTSPLDLTAIQVTDVTDTTARLRWTTNAPATTAVRFGTDVGALNRTRTEGGLSTTHDITLSGLTPGAAWYAAPESGAGVSGAAAVAATPRNFTTLNTARLSAQRLDAGVDAATLSWDANAALAAAVRYGSAPGSLTSTLNAPAGVSGSVEIPNLTPGATYYYEIALSGAGYAPSTTPISTFTTETEQGAVKSITQSTAEELGSTRRVNVDIGGDAGLVTLQKQAIPGAPVTTSPLPAPRYHHAVAAHDGTLYAIGGFDANGDASSTVFHAPILSDGTVGAWAQTTPLPAPRVAIADMAFGYSGRIYVVGGADAVFNSLNTVLYADQNPDGSLGTWRETAALPLVNGRDAASVSVSDGRVYLSGGEDNQSSPTADTAVYSAAIRGDGSLGEWSVVGAMPESLRGHRTRANADALYAFGGHGMDAVYNNRAETAGAEPAGGLTSFLPDPNAMSTPRYNFTAALTGGKLITFSGRERPNGFTRAIEYAPLTPAGGLGPWVVSTEMAPEAVDAPDGKDYDGRIYSVGGRKDYGAGAAANATTDVALIPMTPSPENGAAYAYSGTLESAILDLEETTNLRRLLLSAAGAVRARYRFAGPNGTFSAWLTPHEDGEISGGARYFQYALTLTGDGSTTPVVNSVTLTTGPAAGVVLPGDVDMDGFITRTDAALALQIAGGLLPSTAPNISFTNADVDADGIITVADAVLITRAAD